ncbi:MAG: hypothetical protein AAAC47_13720 [Pararhizobium sp.]
MQNSDISLPYRKTLQRRELTRFAPFLVLESIPWLFAATVFRTRAQGSGGALLVGLPLVQLFVFMAFLLAAHRMISAADGGTSLGRLQFKNQLALARTILRRLLGLSVIASVIAVGFGASPKTIVFYWLGMDGIVFYWYGHAIPFLSAFLAAVMFLMVVEKGMDREPKLKSALMEIVSRWRYLVPAIILFGLFFTGANALQTHLDVALEPVYEAVSPAFGRYFYTGYHLLFSYVRLWLTVAALTYTIRASYRASAGVDAAS